MPHSGSAIKRLSSRFAALALASTLCANILTNGPALAQSVAPSVSPAPICPAELSAWSTKTGLQAAGSKADLRKAALTVGKAFDATLIETPKVKFVRQSEQPGGSVSHGGMFDLTIATAGTYRIALSARSWIDVVRDGKAVASSAHGGNAGCEGVAKLVDFPLTPGRYVIQISGNADAKLGLLVARKP